MLAKAASSLEEWENQVKSTTTARHKQELSLVVNLLSAYLAGFNKLGKFTPNEDNELEYAWLLLTTRSFNSLRYAYDALQKGYYSQAAILIRSALEDWLTAKDCEITPKTVDALLKGNDVYWKANGRYARMAERISFRNKWDTIYGSLSTIAHARGQALGMLINSNSDTNWLRLGADYDNDLFVASCHALLKVGVMMTEFLVKLLGNEATQWQKEAFPTIQEASAYVERISEEANNLSPQSS